MIEAERRLAIEEIWGHWGHHLAERIATNRRLRIRNALLVVAVVWGFFWTLVDMSAISIAYTILFSIALSAALWETRRRKAVLHRTAEPLD